MESRSPKRPADFGEAGFPKKQKVASGPKMSFAEKMMAKMGYKKGEGLGKDASGIATPIEVKLRPQGVGVGAVKEKTPQAKAEARRQAERRGEKYEDSSDEEREARQRRKEAAKRSHTSGYAPPGHASASRPKHKFRTAAEIEAEEGLEVPNVFKSLVDMTGQQPKLLTSTAGLLRAQPLVVASETVSSKLALSAQKELEAFADAWHELQQRRKYVQLQQQHAKGAAKRQLEDLARSQELCTAVDAVSLDVTVPANFHDDNNLQSSTELLADKLDVLWAKHGGPSDLDEVATSALLPPFKRHMSDWEPFNHQHTYNSSFFPQILDRVKPMLNIQNLSTESDDDDDDQNGLGNGHTAKVASPYESMILTNWLPKIRSVIVNDWSPYDAEPMLLLVQEWKPVLPHSVFNVIVNQSVVQKLSGALKTWRPTSTAKDKASSRPHVWLFPWLAHLDEYHLDARSSEGLLADVKRKYRAAFDTWDPEKGVIPGLDSWLEVRGLRSEMKRDLDLKILPRLARYIHEKFDVDPSDQDITPIENVLKWKPFFKPDKLGRVLLDAFFPKWLSVLHLWLTSDPNYEEVGQWFSWWQKDVFPEDLASTPAVAAEWDRGLALMNQALDMGPDKVKTDLPAPTTTHAERRAQKQDMAATIIAEEEAKARAAQEQKKADARADDATTFKDILEDLCEQQDLLMMPLRKAHPETGLPLFRITASAAGVGGVQVYIKGDVVWAQNKKNRSLWEPIDVFEPGTLEALAEAK